MAIVFLLMGDPIWMIAAANFTYLIGICMPNVAVWLLRRDVPDAARPYRAPRGTIMLGLVAAAIWLLSAILGFQQFGLPTVLFGLALGLFRRRALRLARDRGPAARRACRSWRARCTSSSPARCCSCWCSTAPAICMAVSNVTDGHTALMAALEDIFVVVAMLTISVGLVLPGMITHSATEVSEAAKRLTSGTLREFSRAMAALGRGDLDAAHASVNIVPVKIRLPRRARRDGRKLQRPAGEVREAALGLDEAREKMHTARAELLARHEQIAHLAHHDPLTDLPNRTALASRLAETFDRARASGTSFAVLTIDLDHFKEANDVFGHAVGDELLCAIARRLASRGRGAFIARIGGDEFTLVLATGEQPAAAEALADRAAQGGRAGPSRSAGQKIPIGLSIGAAIYPQRWRRRRDAARQRRRRALSRQGRRAAYGALLRPRDGSPPAESATRCSTICARPSPTTSCCLHYQPQAKIDGEVFGFEALVRWQHPKHGFVPPSDIHPAGRTERH